MKPSLLTSTVLLAAALAGCTMGPDYRQPAIVQPLVLKYDQGWQPLPAKAWADSGAWWEAFADAELSALVVEANANNLTLAQATARYRAALAQRRASSADYMPTLSAALDTSRSGGSDSATTDSSRAQLGISWELDLWGRVRRQVESSTAALDASAADLAAARLSIQLAVVNSYVNLRALDVQQRILQQTLSSSERSTQLTRNQYDAGIVSRADVIQAETQLQSLRSDLYDLEAQRAIEENTLAALLGRAPSSFESAADDRLPVVPQIPAQLPSELIARRPDVVSAERGVAAANADIGVAVTAWLPTISLGASGGVSGESISDLWNAPVRFWSVGPSLAQTLFDGGARSAARDLAYARYDEQVAAYRQTVLDALTEVENALATTAILREKAVQQDKLVSLAEENERVITNRYQSGLVSYLEVAIAQNTTLNAKRGQVSVTSAQLAAAAQLAASIGGAWAVGDDVGAAAERPQE
ncbi:efflux transporter outer membrane subunit [Halopseudomonas maritima]|uniref:efflux transporter outer membrane subunit n=1 Tax=Halopseudomonas maritima TaxID=2918528 RepID=UPI001EEBD4D6|nr:efflux transporter outer membrane subunit [Halopseudomonas maritima]UJJ32509.1 efflux transporter outer membrane subunit [Halopseudomonas maritima]